MFQPRRPLSTPLVPQTHPSLHSSKANSNIPTDLVFVLQVLLLLAFAILADTVGSWGRKSFFLFVTITCWLVVIAVFLIFFLSIDKGINVSWTIIVSPANRLKLMRMSVGQGTTGLCLGGGGGGEGRGS